VGGRADFVLERRQGAILLRRWLPNGQKISCEVIGLHYLNSVAEPTPEHVDWQRASLEGGFLIHQNMNNAVDHPNNFTVVSDVDDAVDILSRLTPDPTVEFDPRDYRFWPYLWVNDPGHFGIHPESLKSPKVEAYWLDECKKFGTTPRRPSTADPLEVSSSPELTAV